jgi:hypothetical protein
MKEKYFPAREVPTNRPNVGYNEFYVIPKWLKDLLKIKKKK